MQLPNGVNIDNHFGPYIRHVYGCMTGVKASIQSIFYRSISGDPEAMEEYFASQRESVRRYKYSIKVFRDAVQKADSDFKEKLSPFERAALATYVDRVVTSLLRKNIQICFNGQNLTGNMIRDLLEISSPMTEKLFANLTRVIWNHYVDLLPFKTDSETFGAKIKEMEATIISDIKAVFPFELPFFSMVFM